MEKEILENMYKIIEKNQYGVLVTEIKSLPAECEKCKYTGLAVTLQPCFSCKGDNSYYLPDSEVEKLESENPLMNTTIDDLYIESKCYFEVKKKLDDTQKEHIDLQIENKQLKEKSNDLIKYLEDNVECCKINEIEKDSNDPVDTATYSMYITYKNVLEFIKNQK